MWLQHIPEGTLFTGAIYNVKGTFYKSPKAVYCLELMDWEQPCEKWNYKGRWPYSEQMGVWVFRYQELALGVSNWKEFVYPRIAGGSHETAT
jgi:hypothetical protein